MLGLAEARITDAGLGWAFADTDSMAIAKPEDMTETEFLVVPVGCSTGSSP